jgi:hypothetical protein
MFRNSGEHARTDFLFVMERLNIIRKSGIAVAKFDMRAALRNN